MNWRQSGMLVAEAGIGQRARYGRGRGRQEHAIGMNPTILGTALALALAMPIGAARAQAPPAAAPAAPSFDDVQATIKRMQERLNRLGTAAAERDQALRFLEQQVDQASGEITGAGKTNESLRGEAAALSHQLEDLSRRRDQLQGEVGERGEALASLRSEVATLSGELGEARNARTALAQELEATRASLAAAAAREGELMARVGSLESGARSDSLALADRKAEADRLRQQVAALEAAASSSAKSAAERIATAEAAVVAQAAAVDNLREQLAVLQRTAGESAHAAVVRLAASEGAAAKHRQEAEVLKQEVTDLNQLLAAAETRVDEQQDRIDGLDAQLAQALTKKVAELEQYRSEFFGKLRQVLGNRPDLRVVGDRFVFQSELLFASGSASLDPAGQAQLRQLASTLQDVAARIPAGLDWVLRVDGHTDRQPIRDATFRSNWELSAARAISVIEFLIAQGIAPDHLAAAGFGEYRPIDPADDEVAYRRNRRIEFKLTEG
jgi:chemotaxis protein MotB